MTRISVASITHPGPCHVNDDAVQVIDLATDHRDSLAGKHESPVGFGLVVASGMGGCPCGQPSGELVADALRASLTSPRFLPGDDRTARLDVAMSAAERALVTEVARDRRREGLGASATVGVLMGSSVQLAHIGGTAAFLFRDGSLRRLTRDDTLGASPLAAQYPGNHRLHRLVLVTALAHRKAEPEISSAVDLTRSDVLVLCTEGLVTYVGTQVIEDSLLGSADLTTLRDRLLTQALAQVATGENRSQEVTLLLARVE